MARLVISQTAPTRHTVVVNQTVSPITLEITEQVSHYSVVVSPLTVTNYYEAGAISGSLLGVADGVSDLGTFTGNTISDNQSVKGGLQDLETAVEDNAVDIAAVSNVANANTSAANTNATDITALTTDVQANTAALTGVEANAKDDQDASEVPVTATPANYTAGSSDVEAHLAAIDAALANVGGGQLQASLDPTETQLFFTDPGTYAAGTDIEDVLRDLLIHFQPPSVTNFVANGLPNSAIEHGAADTLTTASWVVTNSGNVDGTVTATLEYQDPLNVQDESWTGIAHTASPYSINKDVIFNVVTGNAGQGSTVRGQTNTYFLRFSGLKNTQGTTLSTRTDYLTVLYRTFVLTSPTAIAAGAVTNATGEGLITDCIAGTNNATVAYNNLHANSLLQTTLTYPSTTQYWYVAMPQCHWEYANYITTNQGFAGFNITNTVVDCGSFLYQNANSQDVAMQLLRGPSLGQIDSGNYIKFEYDSSSALNSVSAPAARTGGGGGSSASGLLVDYPGAAAAYSTRQLISTATNAMRVRRVSDDQEADIDFDSNGDLNTAAIATHCGSSEGYVSKWYDQSGNGNDAEQTTHGSQPQIYNGSAVITDNGKPALKFDADLLLAADSSTLQITGDMFAAVVNTATQVVSFSLLFVKRTSDSAREYELRYQTGVSLLRYLDSSNNKTYSVANTTGQRLFTFNRDANTTAEIFENGSSVGSESLTGTLSSSSAPLAIGGRDHAGFFMYGQIQELILWPTDQDGGGNRSGIETDINNYFQIGNFPNPTSGLLSTYTGAAAAYSVRQLANTAALSMRVRRDNDDAEQDFGFDANGDLDTAAIATFVGSGNNGYVSKWYDQSGNQNDATQSTGGSQPQIASSGAVITENGKPSLQGGAMSTSGLTVTSAGWQFIHVFTTSGQTIWIGSNFSNQLSVQYGSSGAMSYQGAFTGSQSINGTFTPSQQNIVSVGDDGSKTVASFNGSVASDSTGYPSANLPQSIHRLFNGTYGQNLSANYRVQEILLWNSDQFSNRSGIEGNVNAHFQIGNFGTPTSGLLATYTGAAAAYSVRQLSDIAIKCMRVRRDNDDAEQDFGFDTNGDLNTAAIATFVGSGNNGYVSKWYDQSGNQNDATQSTEGSQPQIYNGSAVITENGKPALDFDGSDDFFPIDSTASGLNLNVNNTSSFHVGKYATATGMMLSLGGSAPSARWYPGYFSSTLRYGYSGVSNVSAETGNTNQNQWSMIAGSTLAGAEAWRNGSSKMTATLASSRIMGDSVGIGRFRTSFYLNGNVQEVLIYDSDQSSNRSGIETDINNYFSIY